MKKKKILAMLVMMSLLQGTVYAEDFTFPKGTFKGDEPANINYPNGMVSSSPYTILQFMTTTNNIKHVINANEIHIGGMLSINKSDAEITSNKDVYIGGDLQLQNVDKKIPANLTLTINDGNLTIMGCEGAGSVSGGDIWLQNKSTADITVNGNVTIGKFGKADHEKDDIGDASIEMQNDSELTITTTNGGTYRSNGGIFLQTRAKATLNIDGDAFLYADRANGLDKTVNEYHSLNLQNGCTFELNADTITADGRVFAKSNSKITLNGANKGEYKNIRAYENSQITAISEQLTANNIISELSNSLIDIKANESTLSTISTFNGGDVNVQGKNNEEDGTSKVVNVDESVYAVVTGYSETNDKSEINFKNISYISSQNDEQYHAFNSTERKHSAIRANHNSVVTLDKAAGIYGDIIANRGVNVQSWATDKPAGGQVNITSVDGADFKGDVIAANTGIINFTLNNAAYEGRVDDYAESSLTNVERAGEFGDIAVTEGGTVNLTLNNSTWTAHGRSFVSKLDFGNSTGSTVDLINNGSNSVTIKELTGEGIFNMELNSANHELGDMLYIGKNSGIQTINIIGGITGGLENISKDNPLRFATVGIDETGDEVPAVSNGGSAVNAYTRDAGIFDVKYMVEKEKFDADNSENEKYNGSGNGSGIDKPGNDFVENTLASSNSAVNWIITGAKDQKHSDAGKTIINMSRANYKNAIYMDRLNKRMGEARYINPEEDQGMWVRLRHDRIGMDGDFRSMNTMYELGYDVKQQADNGSRRVGFAVDYMRGSTSYNDIAGKGETKRYGLWLYDTWLGDKGHYADYIIKWGHLSNDFDIMAKTTGEEINGDYSNNVFSISAEYGKKNDLGSSWYFEPQAQLQLARVTGADYVTSQGSRVSADGINSLIGRAGFRLGRDFGERSTVYVKADLLHEFLGDQTITATDVTGTMRETFENKGTWYDVGFGFATMLGNNSYAFFDIERSFGNDNDETYQINAGVNWSF